MNITNFFIHLKKLWNNLPSIIQWLLIGLGLGVGFALPYVWPAVIISIGLFIQQARTATSFTKAMLGGWVAGIVKSAYALIWFWNVFPFDSWLPVGNSLVQILLIFVSLIISVTSLGLGEATLAGAIFIFKKYLKPSSILTVITIPLLWVLSEIIGSVSFSVATSGPGSFIQSYFSFGYLGYLFGITELGIKLAAMAGVYGLTSILVGAVVTTLYLPGHYRYLSAGIWIGALLVTNYLHKQIIININLPVVQ